uniref:Uncharacterized protein n=1 Tax=Rhodosorus marinus TaxID=101924 RepID=A0A7S3A0U6_9RHOD|mmetsp:Transcript_39390/g.156452  ORF Transcript_39390/g.156452 Transcript_39390/m.156452 type:complete len:121 (+) Transcript_39390:53-415(+)
MDSMLCLPFCGKLSRCSGESAQLSDLHLESCRSSQAFMNRKLFGCDDQARFSVETTEKAVKKFSDHGLGNWLRSAKIENIAKSCGDRRRGSKFKITSFLGNNSHRVIAIRLRSCPETDRS